MKGTGVKTLSLHKTGVATETLPHLSPTIYPGPSRAVFNAIFGMYVITTIILFLVKFDHYQRDSVFLKQKQQQKTTS